jgi:hypothetical protein
MPDAPTVATEGTTEDQVPPLVASLNVVMAEGHTTDMPVILPALGSGFTVTTVLDTAVPQLLVTV